MSSNDDDFIASLNETQRKHLLRLLRGSEEQLGLFQPQDAASADDSESREGLVSKFGDLGKLQRAHSLW